MDHRIKTYADEAAKRFAYLVSEFGFTGPEVVDGTFRWWFEVGVRYLKGGTVVEAGLVLGPMGEDYVRTELRRGPEEDPVEVGSNTAHTAYQMRRGLDLQSQALRTVLEADE